ncbi:MAG: FHA domain-containing protein [Sandaracinaceae bacterium]|nr:FHA domain-containing protein [Sandaracinaceae bacterium]
MRDEITIGREEGNTIRLTERNVSRKHARLSRVDGRFLLEDLGSYNGIKVNGSRMGGESDLGAGDQILIGDYRIALESEQTEVASGELDISLSGAHDLVPPARLVMLSQPAPGAEFALSKEEVCIGREEVMDVWVNHRSISREHAKITRKVQPSPVEGQNDTVTFEIQDLDSANGVRVNGQEVFEAVLKQGDIVELGQVRFRYVELGEVFSFDSGESAALTGASAHAEEEDDDEREGLPIIAAVLILGAAIGLAAAIATSGSSSDLPAPEPPAPVSQPDTHAAEPAAVEDAGAVRPAPTDAQRQEAQLALDSCHDGLDAGDLEAALAGAERALVLVPGLEGAEACKLYAAQLIADLEIFERGKQQLAANDVDSAYFTLEQLSVESELRARPEFAAAKLAFARHHVGLAREALAANPEEAANQAQMVVQTPDVPRNIVADAQRILTAAQRRIAAAERREEGASTEGTGPGAAQASTPRRDPVPAPAPEPEDERSPMDQARDCMRAGDNACVVAALEGGRARSAASLSLLIETYRQMGNQEAARRHMRTFVTRYPDDRRATNYAAALGN